MARKPAYTVSTAGTVIKWTAADGSDSFAIDAAELTDAIREQAMLHGIRQKVADAAAGKPNNAEKWAAMRATADALRAGQWNRAGGGGQAAVDTAALKAAIVEVATAKAAAIGRPVDAAALEAKVAAMRAAELRRYLADPEVAAAYAARAAAGAPTPSIDDLLAG